MEPSRYLTLLQAESDRLAGAARDRLGAPVPACPGWTVLDLVEHVAMVYDYVVACMRELRHPDWWPSEPPAGDRLDWLTDSRDRLVAELVQRGPDAPSYTWYPPDQTVGFWYRRMAQETAVHRADAELAGGDHTPVADDLAADGVDEMLHVMLAGEDWTEEPQPPPARQVLLACGDLAWYVELATDHVTVTDDRSAQVQATVTGAPSDLLLWLWGRLPDSSVLVDGDDAAVAALRARLASAAE